ncbi:MAG: YdcF family protein, partial [Alphaproteobacteria bacterium]
MTIFIVLKFLAQLVTPPGMLVLGLMVGGLLVLLRLPRPGKIVAMLGVAQAVIFSLNPVADAMLMPLEDRARAEAASAPACCYGAIVVLGAGVVTSAPPLRPDPELTDSSDRLWQAARLYHRGLAPRIIVSGGSYAARRGGPTQTEAEAMREVLLALGVPADRIILEARSLNTIDNIREIRGLVGTERIALVTSGHHMPRALK